MSESKTGQTLPKETFQVTGSEKSKIETPEEFKDQWTLLYFYPKDDTPGCTKQACHYRDQKSDFDAAGIQIFGVSLDDESSHQAFQSKYDLNFPLIVDADKKLSQALDVYGEQKYGDQTFMGLSRDTFLIDPDGKVAKEWRNVDPTTTVQETLDAAKKMMS